VNGRRGTATPLSSSSSEISILSTCVHIACITPTSTDYTHRMVNTDENRQGTEQHLSTFAAARSWRAGAPPAPFAMIRLGRRRTVTAADASMSSSSSKISILSTCVHIACITPTSTDYTHRMVNTDEHRQDNEQHLSTFAAARSWIAGAPPAPSAFTRLWRRRTVTVAGAPLSSSSSEISILSTCVHIACITPTSTDYTHRMVNTDEHRQDNEKHLSTFAAARSWIAGAPPAPSAFTRLWRRRTVTVAGAPLSSPSSEISILLMLVHIACITPVSKGSIHRMENTDEIRQQKDQHLSTFPAARC